MTEKQEQEQKQWKKQELAALFDGMDDDAQADLLRCAKRLKAEWPRKQVERHPVEPALAPVIQLRFAGR